MRRLATENVVFPRLDVPEYLLFSVQVKAATASSGCHDCRGWRPAGWQMRSLRGCRIIGSCARLFDQGLPQSRSQLFGLLLDAGHFAYAVEQKCRSHPAVPWREWPSSGSQEKSERVNNKQEAIPATRRIPWPARGFSSARKGKHLPGSSVPARPIEGVPSGHHAGGAHGPRP